MREDSGGSGRDWASLGLIRPIMADWGKLWNMDESWWMYGWRRRAEEAVGMEEVVEEGGGREEEREIRTRCKQ